MVVRGNQKDKSGKVLRVNTKHQRVYIEKINRKKTDNTELPIGIHPSNLVITKIAKTKDRKRQMIINRRTKNEDSIVDIDAYIAEIEAEEEVEDGIIDFDEDVEAETEELDEGLELEDETEEEEEAEEEEAECSRPNWILACTLSHMAGVASAYGD